MDQPQSTFPSVNPIQSQPMPTQPITQDPSPQTQEAQPQTVQTPPAIEPTPSQQTSPIPQVVYAGFVKRFLAFVIDVIILMIIAVPINLVFSLFQAPLTAIQTVSNPEINAAAFSAMEAAKQIVMIVINLGYGIGFLTLSGATPGKMALGLMVVGKDFHKVSLGKAVMRETIGKFLSSIALCLGYLWVIWDGKKQGWHDKIAGTFVVEKKSLSVEK